MPPVAQAHRTAQASIAVAAYPHRYARTAVVIVVVPGSADSPQVVVGQLSPFPERDAQCAELLRGPADAGPEDQARTRRPPLSSLRLAAIRAMSRGCRYGTIKTVVPSLILPVMPASQASVVKGS